MLDSYTAILKRPGAARFTLSGAVARLPASMTGLGIVLIVVDRSGSYALAGVIAACYTAALAVFAPLQGRLADQFGQRPLLFWSAVIYTLGVIALLLAAHPLGQAGGAAIAGAAAPQAGNLVRSRWTYLLRDDRSYLGTAFAIEAVLDEAVFIVGPVIVTWLTLSVANASGLLTAAGCALAGGFALALQRSTEPPASGRNRGATAPFRLGFLIPMIVAAIGLGAAFGAMEVLATATSAAAHRPTMAGALLAAWAAGSLIAGSITGALPEPQNPVRRLRVATSLFLLSWPPMFFADSLWLLALFIFISGLTIAPILITATGLIELTTPPPRLTEALTWMSTGLSIGIAPGAIASGWVVDAFSPTTGFWVPFVATTLTALVAVLYRGPQRFR